MAEMTAGEKAKARLAKFQEAKKKAEEEKANKGGFPKEEVPEFKCCVLNKDKPRIIRLMGNSPLMREKDTDPLIVNRAMCVNDDGNYVTIIMPEDRDNPINKLWRTIIGKYTWDKENNCRIYNNKGKPSFERFIRNGKKQEECDSKERGMLTDKFYLFNCLDKTDNWCEENKHTKLLCWDSKNKEVDGETRTYYTYGIKSSLYNNIFDVQCTNLNRMYDQFDVVAKRLSKPLGNDWLVVCSPEEKTKITNMGLDASKVTMEYLSEDEEKYTLYKLEDIPFISRATSISFVLKNFPKLIKSCDLDFGTNLYEEFVEGAEKEKAEWAKKNAENAEKTTESKTEDTSAEVESEESEVEETTATETTQSFDTMETVETSSEELPSEVEENPTPTVQKVAKVVKSTAFNIVSLYDKFPHLKELSDDEKSLVIGEENGVLKFKSGIEIAQCPICCERLIKEGHSQEEIDSLGLADIPDGWTKCGVCGTSFE